MKKLFIIISVFFILLFGAYGMNKMYRIVTRFEYDKVERVMFKEAQSLSDQCYYIFYTLDNDQLTDFGIADIYELDKSTCNVYVVNMNDLENQKYMNSNLNESNIIDTLPMLVKYENNLITEIKKLKKD